MSGLPGMALPVDGGGVGFDYRLSMGMPDHWIRTLSEHRDEHWRIGDMWHQFSSHRPEEKSVAYAESHDQALVGDKTLIFRLVDAEMYSGMSVFQHSPVVERGVALHKMIRLFSFASGGQAYLNFMGNEFGHPEWIDFPRKGNCWSHHYARRQWSLLHDKNLRYKYLAYFDRQMLECAYRHNFIQSFDQYLFYEHADDQVIAFRKGDVFLLFNFSPTQSYADYWVPFPDGEYQLILDSDAKCFDGQGRVEAGQKYFSKPEKDSKGNPTGRRGIQVYLPSRTALVFVCGEASPLYKQEYFT
jgi:1,4-alpha-glucan branching enzyme